MVATVRGTDTQMKRRARWLQVVLVSLLLCAAGEVLAVKRIDPRAQTLNVSWAGGDINTTFNFCVASTDSNNLLTPPVIPYTVRASIGGTGAPFTLASGANTVPLTLAWRDLVTNALYPLNPDTDVPGFQLTGDLRNCPTYTFNGRLEVTITQANLTGKPPGTYVRVFTLETENARGGPGGRDTTTLTISVVIPDSIAVTNINDIVLGTWDGISDMVGSDSLCVYRAGGLTYGVLLTGSGAGGAFAVTQGASQIPLQVTWNDGTGAVPATPGLRITPRTNAFASSSTCNGGTNNNATLGVTATAANIGTVPMAGTYAGVITVNVIIQ